jgi:predicted TIM-barrel fold metal-dependent hydrolase
MHTQLSRRTLLTGAAGASAAMLLASPAAADDKPPSDEKHPYIDAHSHIWTRDIEKFPLAKGRTLKDLVPPSFTAEELLEMAHPVGVGKVVLIQHHGHHGWDNSYLIDAARRYPDAFRVVGMVDNLSDKPGQQMRDLLPKKVTAFRITPWVHKEKWLTGGMDEMWKTAAETGQQMCCLIDVKDLADVDAMCAKHAGTPVVIDHFARIGVDGEIRDKDVEALARLARHKNTTLKVSAYYALGKKKAPYLDLAPMIRRMLDAFGPERCMWASDAPYQVIDGHTYADSIALIKDRLDFLSDGDKAWLLGQTAKRVYYFA